MKTFDLRCPLLALSGAIVLTAASACEPTGPGEGEGEGEGEAACTAGETWCAADFDTHAAEPLALRDQLDTLVGDATLRGMETGAVTFNDVSDLTAVFEAGEPSLEDTATPAFATRVTALLTEFADLMNVGPLDLVDANGDWAPGAAGGVFGSSDRGINEGGLEVRQLVDKGGLTGGLMYGYALSLTEGDVDAATVEAIAAAWGTDAALDPETVTDAANYSHRMGYFAPIADALEDAHVAAVNGDDTGLDAALVQFFRLWEESMYARAFYYANAAADAVGTDTEDETVADAIHGLSEGVGLALGFHDLPDPSAGPLSGAGRLVDDATIESMMTSLGVDVDDFGASTTGELIVDPTTFATRVADVEADVRAAFSADDTTIEEWKVPTAG